MTLPTTSNLPMSKALLNEDGFPAAHSLTLAGLVISRGIMSNIKIILWVEL